MSAWVSLADIVERLKPSLSDGERADYEQLANAIGHATQIARNMPTTLDARARALVVTKLQEAEHWSLELLRAAYTERNEREVLRG